MLRQALGLTALLFTLRLLAAWPALNGEIYNLDEVEMAWSVLDRALGIPSTTLAWPNSLLQLLSLAPTFAAQVGTQWSHGLDGLVQGLALGYRVPWRSVFVVRAVVAAVFSLATGLWFWVLLRDGMKRLDALLLVLVGTSVPLLWLASLTAKGEGLALPLVLTAFALPRLCPCAPRSRLVLLQGALAGATLASRNTLLPALLPLAVYACEKRPRAYVAWAGASVVTFIAACPSSWLEPLRLGKSIAGNLLRPTTSSPFEDLRAVMDSTPFALWVLGLLAGYVAFTRRNEAPRREWHMVITTAAVVFALSLAPLLGRQLSAGYFLSIPCLLWVLLLLQAPYVFTWANARLASLAFVPRFLRQGRLLQGTLVLVCVFHVYCCVATAHEAQARYRPLRELRTQLLAQPRKALLPRVFLPYFAEHTPAATLLELSAAAASAQVLGEATTSYLIRSGLPRQAALGLRHNFDEDEQAFAARLAVAASVEAPVPLPLEFYDHLPGPSRFGMPDTRTATQRMERREVQLLAVMSHPLPASQPSAHIEPGADWGLYLYSSSLPE